MDCSQPPALSEDQLSAAIDELAPPEVLAHLAACPGCAARLAAARTFEQALGARLFRYDCPPVQALSDFHWGLLAAEPADAVAAHVQRCPACSVELAELRQNLADTAASQVPTAPPARTRWPSLRTLQARSSASGPVLALRGSSDQPILATAGPHTLFLALQPEGDQGLALAGQLLAQPAEPWQSGLVEVRQAGAVRYVAVLEPHGGFQCSLPTREPVELRFVAEGEPVIVFRDLVPPS